jgi:hypothetical protein
LQTYLRVSTAAIALTSHAILQRSGNPLMKRLCIPISVGRSAACATHGSLRV